MIPVYPFSGKTSRFFIPLLLFITVCVLQVLPVLSTVHLFDWDEINFAESAREMLITGDFSIVRIGFLPFWEKPPLFIWMQAGSMYLFGINEFAARFPNFLASVITLMALYLIGTTLRSSRFGFTWVLLYFGSLLPNIYFHSGIIDPWYNLFSFLCFYFFLEARGRSFYIALAGFFLGLAVITKGPAILLIFGLTLVITAYFGQSRIILDFKNFFIFLICLLVSGGSWFIFLIISGKFSVVDEFIRYQWRLLTTADAGHSGGWYYHLIVLLIGCFPASVFALKNLFSFKRHSIFGRWMMIAFWVNLIVFSVVKTKIAHYSSFCYFPLTFLAAEYVLQSNACRESPPMLMRVLLQIILALLVLVLILIPFLFYIIEASWSELFDLLLPELSGNLRQAAGWNLFDLLPGLLLAAFGEYGLICYFKGNRLRGVLSIGMGVMVTVFVTAFTILPKIEQYSQGKLIEYFKRMNQLNAPVRTFYFKSYADLFYFGASSANIGRNLSAKEFVSSEYKVVYAVTKSEKTNKLLDEFPCFKLDSISGGYSFFHCAKDL